MQCVDTYIRNITYVRRNYGSSSCNMDALHLGHRLKFSYTPGELKYMPTYVRVKNEVELEKFYDECDSKNESADFIYPIIVGTEEYMRTECSTLSRFLKCAVNPVLTEITFDNKTYYAANGIILDSNFNLLLVAFSKKYSDDLLLLLSKDMFSSGNKLEKALSKEIVKSIWNFPHLEVGIINLSDFVLHPVKPKPSEFDESSLGEYIKPETDDSKQEDQEC